MSPLRPWLAGLGGLLLAIASSAQPLRAGGTGLAPAGGPAALHFARREGQSFQIAVQRVDARTGATAGRAGPLYLTSDYTHIDYPTAPALNVDGRADLRLVLHPPVAGQPAGASSPCGSSWTRRTRTTRWASAWSSLTRPTLRPLDAAASASAGPGAR